MKKLLTTFCALALSVTVANAQTDKGTMSFGVGTNFTTVDNAVNVGYFVMDGIMINAEFNMAFGDDGETNWGLGGRYYIGEEGLWAGLSLNNANDYVMAVDAVEGVDAVVAVEASEGVEAVEGVDAVAAVAAVAGVEDGVDAWLGVGYSKALGFDGRLWFEPSVGYTMPNVGDGSIGMRMGFRLAF